jgi:hypothetical protein
LGEPGDEAIQFLLGGIHQCAPRQFAIDDDLDTLNWNMVREVASWRA